MNLDPRLTADLREVEEEQGRKQEAALLTELEELRKLQDNLSSTIIPDDKLIEKEIQEFSPSISALISVEDFKALSNKEKDELRELNKELAKNPKKIEEIRAWLQRKRQN